MIKQNIYVMYAIALLQGMVFYGPIATLYRQAQGVSIFQITVIESISLALCLLLELPWGIAADQIGYKRTMMICCGLYFASKIVFWQAAGFAAFLLERIMLSVVIAGFSGVETSVLYLSCPPDKSQKVFGTYNTLQTTGLLTASLVYAIAIKDHYKTAGLLTALSYGLAALLAFGLVEVHPQESCRAGIGEFVKLLRQTLQNKYFLLFLVGVALLNETHQTITVFLNQLQYVKCGITPAEIGYIYIGVTIAGLCGGFSARITKKVGVMPLAAILIWAAAAACLALAVTHSAWLSVAGILVLRVSFSLFQPLQMDLQNKQVYTANRATALSINAVLIDSVGVATNVAFGKLADAHLMWAMLFGAGLCAAGFILFSAWYCECVRKPSSSIEFR